MEATSTVDFGCLLFCAIHPPYLTHPLLLLFRSDLWIVAGYWPEHTQKPTPTLAYLDSFRNYLKDLADLNRLHRASEETKAELRKLTAEIERRLDSDWSPATGKGLTPTLKGYAHHFAVRESWKTYHRSHWHKPEPNH